MCLSIELARLCLLLLSAEITEHYSDLRIGAPRQLAEFIFRLHLLVCYNTIQYNFIDLRRRNSLLVRLRDRDAGWKRRLF